jgi:hypothetical protein
MKLTPTQRIVLMKLLPAEGGLVNMRTVRRLKEALSFESPAEHKALGILQEGDAIPPEFQTLGPDGKPITKVPAGSSIFTKLNKETNVESPIDISPEASAVIRRELDKLSAAEKVRDEHLDLFPIFCPDSDTENEKPVPIARVASRNKAG